MPDKKIASHKSLLSIGLLSLLVGLSSTACGSTEAASKTDNSQVVAPAETKENGQSEVNAAAQPKSEPDDVGQPQTTTPQPNPETIAQTPESEIDPADAYISYDDNPPPISAEAAGEESGPLKDIADDEDYVAPPVDDSYIAGEEQSEFFYTGTPVVNAPVADVMASLEQGMPYADARALIVRNGWEPIVDPTVDTTYDASLRSMHEMGYVEAGACSGTGLGFCSMAFSGKDGVILGITLTTSSEVPNVWNWSVNTL